MLCRHSKFAKFIAHFWFSCRRKSHPWTDYFRYIYIRGIPNSKSFQININWILFQVIVGSNYPLGSPETAPSLAVERHHR